MIKQPAQLVLKKRSNSGSHQCLALLLSEINF